MNGIRIHDLCEKVQVFIIHFFLSVLYLGNLWSFIPFVIIPQLPFVYKYSYNTNGNLVSTSETYFGSNSLFVEAG